ncbi:hypothetical protein H7B90_00815 [Cohnella xylanilytica]|uniref:GxxExxY protein n=1 Tax=Cohnella xylanilytica TaxID=557555 RepID=A0A841TUU2_9BACL|nr:hypothetical protein [Cohnella xylanilytica]MBB6689933.1 hypothetical protein [Cohnella xylanilytica]
MDAIQRTEKAIRSIRIQPVNYEVEIHAAIRKALLAHEIGFDYEVRLAPRNRIDFLTHERVGIEVKKGKPNELSVLRQLNRYAAFPEVEAIILVIQRYQDVPSEVNGKPCMSIGLNKLWGIASR